MLQEAKDIWRIDPHSHSTRSDARISPRDRAAFAIRARLDAYGDTDHDEWAPKHLPYDQFIPRLKGIEVSTGTGHLLLYLPEGTRPRKIPIFTKLADTVRFARDQGLAVVAPHVNVAQIWGSISSEAVERLYDAGLTLDGIEVAHPYFVFSHQQRVRELVRKYDIAPVGTSDDHTGNIGRRFYTLVPRVSDDPVADFYVALERKTTSAAKSKLELLKTPRMKNALRHITAHTDNLPTKAARVDYLLRALWEYYTYEWQRAMKKDTSRVQEK